MLSSCLLLKKGMILSSQAIQSLESGKNVYKLKHFEEFLKNGDQYKPLLKTFKDDDNIYQTFYKQMSSKLYIEVTNTDY